MNDNRQVEVFCRPVIMDAVCATGRKCFHETWYLYTDTATNPLPLDACVINCRVSGLNIVTSARLGNCYRLTGNYTVRVWFENPATGEVGLAERVVDFNVQIPVEEVAGGCVLCGDQSTEICVVPVRIHCIEACIEPVTDPDVPFAVRIRVVVEKEFFVAETGRSIVCLPSCPTEECIDIPTPVGPVECPSCYTEDSECFDWCAEDEEVSPDNCDQCPPPQVGV